MLVREEKATAIKDQLGQESKAWNHKPRYGLFSYKSHHGFGHRDDTSQNNKRDETGKVKTGPKNFAAGRPQSANIKLDAFTRTGYLGINDEYIEPNKTMKYRDYNPNKSMQVHGANWKPNGQNSSDVKGPYEYISDPMEATRSGQKPKNFMTAPMKKGYGATTYGHLFSHPAHAVDPFDNPAAMSSKERKDHWAKIHSGAFYTTYPKRDHFTPNYRVFKNPNGMNGYRPQTSGDQGLRPFLRSNPPKKGYNCTINPFPDYAEEGEQRLNQTTSNKSEGVWRYTYKGLTTPTPSVNHYNALNRPRRKI